jgi:hypothetical protein
MRLAACLALAVAGCSTPPPAVVKVPVAIPCVPGNLPARPPMLGNEALRGLSDEALVLTIAAERLEQGAYAAMAEGVIRACR